MIYTLNVELFYCISGVTTREVGQSVTFTCPGDVNKNYTYTFSKGGALVKSDARIKQDGQVLTIQHLNFLDSGLYSCSFYDENGNKIGGHSFGYFVVSQGIFLLKHLLNRCR